MGQVRHGSATTTYAVRAAIQRSQASISELIQELGINPKTVAKWREQQKAEGQLYVLSVNVVRHVHRGTKINSFQRT